jgi:hypothetical protein
LAIGFDSFMKITCETACLTSLDQPDVNSHHATQS